MPFDFFNDIDFYDPGPVFPPQKPVRPYQLTYEQFCILPPGTHIVFCHQRDRLSPVVRTLRRLESVSRTTFDTSDVEYNMGTRGTNHFTDNCFRPYDTGRWNPYNWVELPKIDDWERVHRRRETERLEARRRIHRAKTNRNFNIPPISWLRFGF